MTDFHQQLIDLRRALHRVPEIGFDLPAAKSAVADHLRTLGIEVHEGVGVVGVLTAGNDGRTIGLRADMDALPISETSTHGYASTVPGRMHACGHDGHMTMLLGAAELLSGSSDFDGRVVFLFQPNEENGLGAQAMINEGVLDRFGIEEIYAIHNLPGAPLGQMSTRVGQICTSESLFEIEITGQSGHASMPHACNDALGVAAEIVLALRSIVSRRLIPGSGAVVSVTEMITDGTRNVLPGHALLKGDARARTPDDRAQIESAMRQIVEGIGKSNGVATKMRFETEFVETINAHTPTQAAVRVAQKLGLEADGSREPMSFSEDFAHFANLVPGCFLLLGNGNEEAHAQPLHSSDYDFNDALLPIGAEFWAQLVRDRLPKKEI